jgi:hypothetical protein
MRRSRSLAAAGLVAVVAGGTAAAVALSADSAPSPMSRAALAPSAWRGLVGAPRPPVALGSRVIVLLSAPSLADHVRLAGGTATDAEERRWTASVLAGQEQFLTQVATKGVIAKPDLRFARVVNGFSAVADARAVALLERSPGVAGVFPVRAAYPATLDERPGQESSVVPSALAEYTGRGITVALLDTAVDPATPFLHGRVQAGWDVVGGGAAARYDRRPGGDRLERHGTEIAGILAGLGGSGRPDGIAPGVSVLPVRVAGWQRDLAGRWTIHARTDQLIAGLERAVDPNRDGNAHDAARISLVPLAEPFAAFADDPLARAAAGAATLDSLVVVPAGNDGPGGPAFGSIAGPGGAPAALTVGAVDLGPPSLRVAATIRAGLDVLLRRALPLLTSTGPAKQSTLALVTVARVSERAFFDPSGGSRVAGKAVLVPPGAAPRTAVSVANRARAAAVVLAGTALPAGTLGGASVRQVPVLGAPASLVAGVRRATAAGETAWLTVQPGEGVSPTTHARPATFSSWGLAFGGYLKPDVSAPGVAVATAGPGADAEGRSRFVSVSGSSAAAAIAAGLAARLAEARPELDAAALRSALVGSATAYAQTRPEARGAGLLDAGRAATVELVSAPSSLAFGRGAGDGWQARRALVVRSVSSRPLTVVVSSRLPPGSAVAVEVRPRRFRLRPGEAATIHTRAWAVQLTGAHAAVGSLRLTPRGGTAVDVPWSVVLAPVRQDLVGEPRLSAKAFPPSDLRPAVLAVRVGAVSRKGGRTSIEPVLRLDVLLRDGDGKMLGLVARLRSVLPGRYAFGLTGRDPDGRRLAPGPYSLRLVAWPAAGGRPVSRVVRFRIS